MFFSSAILFLCLIIGIYCNLHKNELFRRYVMHNEVSLDLHSKESLDRNVNETLISKSPISLKEFVCSVLYKYMVATFLVILVSFGLFPGVVDYVDPADASCSDYSKKWFRPVWVFLLFNVGDTIGRLVSITLQYPRADEVIYCIYVSSNAKIKK